MSDSLYLYGFVPAGTVTSPEIEGVGRRPVDVVEHHGIGAVVSRVPAEEFAPDAIEERMRDVEWLTEHGARHERIVTWFVDHHQIVPVRLLTLYSSEEALGDAIAQRREEILGTMERLRGLREWDLKVSHRPEELEASLGEVSETIAEVDREIEEAAPGRRFLLERKRGRMARTEGTRAVRTLADDLVESLEPLVEELERLPLPREARDHPLVLNAALLVAREQEEALRATADASAKELDARGVTVELTGPWAPYRFVGEAGDGHGDGGEDDGAA